MLRRLILSGVVFLLFSNLLLGQAIEEEEATYDFSKALDYKICATGLVLGSVDYFLLKNTEALSQEEILKLDKLDVNSFDRKAADNWSPKAGDVSDILEYVALALPSTLMLSQEGRRDWDKIFLMYGETLLINTTFTSLIKLSTKRTRPFIYNQNLPIEIKLGKSARTSFPSGHTSHSSAMSFFVAKVFSDLYPDSNLKPLVWTLAASYPVAMGYLRVAAGKHFPTDVIAGAISGAFIGYIIPHLHKRHANLSKGLSLTVENGVGLAYRF